jgi:hypothetical protein
LKKRSESYYTSFRLDIDNKPWKFQAVALLKALEGENDATLSMQLKLFHERALPNLANNIKCGNSLIGSDYVTSGLILNHNAMIRVNPFDWNQAFPDAMKASGSTALSAIHRRPYSDDAQTHPQEAELLGDNYQAASQGNYDIYVVFIEQGYNC